MGYEGGIAILKEFTLPYRMTRKSKSSIRFETAPGLQAQVDWAELGCHRIDDKRVRLSLFVMVLAYSRMLYAELTADEKQETFLACHEHAFAYFGGTAEEILYDNAKTVALKHDRDGVVFTPALLDFVYLKGFKPRVCKPARPQTKGKVERAIRYIRDSFLEGETFAGLEDMRSRLIAWMDSTANVRVHEATGRRPIDLLLEENLTIPRKIYERIEVESKAPFTAQRAFRLIENIAVESADPNIYGAMFA